MGLNRAEEFFEKALLNRAWNNKGLADIVFEF